MGFVSFYIIPGSTIYADMMISAAICTTGKFDPLPY
jgi:hypothetical protein